MIKDIHKRREQNAKVVQLRFESGRENKGALLLAKAYIQESQYEMLRAQTAATKAKIAKAMKGANNPAYKDGRRSYREKVKAKKGQIVDHADGNSKNNAKSNLKKMSASEHNKKHHREGNRVRCSVIDEHVCGLFPEAD